LWFAERLQSSFQAGVLIDERTQLSQARAQLLTDLLE